MKLTLLGCYGPYPAPGKACSGYLLEQDGRAILVDCGNGILSRLLLKRGITDLEAIFLSHLHADHYSDILIMRYGLAGAVQKGLRDAPLPLYAPSQPEEEFRRLFYKDAYDVQTLEAGQAVEAGPFIVSAFSTIHAVQSLAFRVESAGKALAYSGDSELCGGLEEAARGAGLFLCEANYLEHQIEAGLPNHLSAAQAGSIALEAGVEKLLITHHHPEGSLANTLTEARLHFPGAQVALEGETHEL